MNFRFFGSAFIAAACLQVVSAQVLVTFPMAHAAGSETHALALPAGKDGLYVTVGVVGADVTKGKAGEQTFELLAQDPQSRITLLKGKQGGKVPTFGSSKELKPGSALYLKADQSGAVSRVVSWEGSFHEQQLPLDFLRVHFGGPLPKPGQPLYDAQGRLVALTHQPSPDFGNGAYALPIEAVVRNLEDYQAHKALRRCWLGLNLDHKNPIPVIEGLRPESPAAKAGLKKGDILISLGGWPITTYSSAINAFYYLLSEKEVPCVVLRGTEVLNLKVIPLAHPSYSVKPKGE